MDQLNSVIIFLGKNIRTFFMSVLFRFISFIIILILSVALFLYTIKLFKNPFYSIFFFLLIIMANYIVNKILFKNYTFDLINKYSDEIEINDMLSEYDININDLKNIKKKINDILKSNKIRIIPGKYLFALSFITEKYGERSGFQKNKIRASITEHYKQIFLENLITLIISLPFFLISIIFTLGYRSELLILSILLAFIFLLFIKSALITPIFYLITLKKLSLVFKD